MESQDVQLFKSLGLQQSSVPTASGSTVNFYHRFPKDADPSYPILVLIHGYPQSSYMWRYVVRSLPADIPLFIPDIPGYGLSTPSTTKHDKRTIGQAILSALSTHLQVSNTVSKPISIILGGHDRGARICQRLATDLSIPGSPSAALANWSIVGTVILDIMPVTTQWSSLSNPKFARGTFHWPFLANAALAAPMIVAYGGGKWCREIILRWAGEGDAGLETLRADDALEVYAGYFENERVVRASCDDYEAGSNEDVVMEKDDQEAGRGIGVDTLLMFSKDYLGSRYDVPKGWKTFMMEKAELKIREVKGVGHFLPEEAPEEVPKQVAAFYMEVLQKVKARA